MEIVNLIQGYLSGEIIPGDAVSVTGSYTGANNPFEAPYYFCQEEQYFYRFDYRSPSYAIEKKLYHFFDSLGYHDYFMDYLSPTGREYEIAALEKKTMNNAVSLPYQINALHFITFGLKEALGYWTRLGGSEATYDSVTATGTLFMPKNGQDSNITLGIGSFTELRYTDSSDPDHIYATLDLTKYDPRPEINLFRFSDDFQKYKIEEILYKTEMKYDDFHWVLKDEDPVLNPDDYWIKSDWWLNIQKEIQDEM